MDKGDNIFASNFMTVYSGDGSNEYKTFILYMLGNTTSADVYTSMIEASIVIGDSVYFFEA
ncbi:MAG: hypothetical protein KAH32_09225 [Chlamydiia bacterium]|nr:hypothetical protein [Chlamydiia bacterium]